MAITEIQQVLTILSRIVHEINTTRTRIPAYELSLSSVLIYHIRNLKTSNVLVDEDANAKLSDINILTRHSVSIYSAPELFEDGEYTEYSDVWSAGCIFMEMLTRHNPWYYENSDITLPEIRQRLQ